MKYLASLRGRTWCLDLTLNNATAKFLPGLWTEKGLCNHHPKSLKCHESCHLILWRSLFCTWVLHGTTVQHNCRSLSTQNIQIFQPLAATQQPLGQSAEGEVGATIPRPCQVLGVGDDTKRTIAPLGFATWIQCSPIYGVRASLKNCQLQCWKIKFVFEVQEKSQIGNNWDANLILRKDNPYYTFGLNHLKFDRM